MNDMLKTKGKFRIMIDNYVDEYGTHTVTGRIMISCNSF